MPRSTHTVVTMGVPQPMYDFIRKELLAAGYVHAVDDADGLIDMHGIALVVDPDAAGEG